MSRYEPLSPSFANVVAFVDGLFDPAVRKTAAVIDSIKAGKLFHSFADPKSRGLVLRSWLNAWKKAEGDGYDGSIPQQPTDAALLAFLARYVRTNELLLYVPAMNFAGVSVYPPKPYPFYSSATWSGIPFRTNGRWNYGAFNDDGELVDDGSPSTVARYLEMIYYGAHVVVAYSSDDTKGMKNFGEAFLDAFSSDTKRDVHHSHYGANLYTSRYYLDVDASHERADGPLIAAYLVGNTANQDTNSFTQLEGWVSAIRADGEWGGARHSADYDAHTATLWNFSTFGACAYSEKRASTVFLANATFNPAVDHVSHMPSYRGAGSYQGWMNPGYNTQGALQGAVYDPTSGQVDGLMYFFHGGQYLKLSIASHAPDEEHHPKPIEDKFKGIGDWKDFFAVVCNPGAGKKGKYYFFKGTEYLEWDIDKWEAAGHHSVASGFPGLAEADFLDFNATVYDPYRGDKGKFYFFRGDQFLSFDLAKKKADWSSPRRVADYFYGLKETGLTTIVTAGGYWLSTQVAAGIPQQYVTWMIYFFNGNEFVAFDSAAFRVAGGLVQPRPIYDPATFSGLWWY